jgi:hypothetical protein
MPPISGTLQATDDFMLWKVFSQLGHCQMQRPFNFAFNCEDMIVGLYVGDHAVVSVVAAVLFRNETLLLSVKVVASSP